MAGYYFDVLETVEEPEEVFEGKFGELIATRAIEPGKNIVVVYKEISSQGGVHPDRLPYQEDRTAQEEEEIVAQVELESIVDAIPKLLNMPYRRIWYSYDEEADVLYLNFKKPSHADDSELTDDDLIIRYEEGKIIGITVLHASKRQGAGSGTESHGS